MLKALFVALILCATTAAAAGLHAQPHRPPVLHISAADLWSDVVVFGSIASTPNVIETTIRSGSVDLTGEGAFVVQVQKRDDENATTERRLAASTGDDQRR